MQIEESVLPRHLPELFGQHGSVEPVVYAKFTLLGPRKVIFYVLEGSARGNDFGVYCYQHSRSGGTFKLEKLSKLKKLRPDAEFSPRSLRRCVREDFGEEIDLPILY